MALPPVIGRYLDRIDAMTLRERVMIFIAAASILVAWAYQAGIAPLLTERATKLKTLDAQRLEMRSWDAQLEDMAKAKSAGAENKQTGKLDALQRQVAEIDQRIDSLRRQLVPSDRMASLLAEVLRRNRGLKLDSMTTVAPELIEGVTLEGGGRMYRHGIQLTVTGSYLDIVSYLEDLERLQVKLYWGNIDISTNYPVTTLRTSFYTFSPEKAWLSL